MLPAFKECVEEAFVRGLIKVVFATETLALGINMPARSVVLEKLVKYNGETHADITPGEYTQLTGRAGRRGIDVEGHAVVLWQPGLDPRAVAGLASRRTYPLRSSFAPTYNMAVNLVGSVGRDRARTLLEQSFAQFQSDRSRRRAGPDPGPEHRGDRRRTWAQRGLRPRRLRRVRPAAGRDRRAGGRRGPRAPDRPAGRGRCRRCWASSRATSCGCPSGKSQGWVVVHRPRHPRRATRVRRPLVMTEDRQVRRLSLTDFPAPPVVAGRMRVPKHFNAQGAGLAAQPRRRRSAPSWPRST